MDELIDIFGLPEEEIEDLILEEDMDWLLDKE